MGESQADRAAREAQEALERARQDAIAQGDREAAEARAAAAAMIAREEAERRQQEGS
jgi:hypothetical protein